MSSLPSYAGQLAIDFQEDFMLEKSLHCNERYSLYLKKARALITDNTVCCYCGFPDGRFLELHHVNGDHDDYKNGNLEFICTLCHRLQHLGWVGVSNLGKIIYLPAAIDDNSRFWLEPFQYIQRFYLMQDYLTNEERKRLKNMRITQDIDDMHNMLKSQDIDVRYMSAKKERWDFLAEQDELSRLVGDDKTKKLEEVKAERERRKAERDRAKVGTQFDNLHILDLLDVLILTGKKDEFLKTQNEGRHGRMAIWFNSAVFEPFELNPQYTLQQRLKYYKDKNLFSAKGLKSVMHNIRNQ